MCNRLSDSDLANAVLAGAVQSYGLLNARLAEPTTTMGRGRGRVFRMIHSLRRGYSCTITAPKASAKISLSVIGQ